MSSWANENALHCHVANLSLIDKCSVLKQTGAYSASEMQCLLENESSYRTSLPWLDYEFLQSYSDFVSCVGTIRKTEKFKAKQKP